MSTDGGGELTRRRPLPEAAYAYPDERNRRLVRASLFASEILWVTRVALMTPAQRFATIEAYARRINEVTDMTQEFRP